MRAINDNQYYSIFVNQNEIILWATLHDMSRKTEPPVTLNWCSKFDGDWFNSF